MLGLKLIHISKKRSSNESLHQLVDYKIVHIVNRIPEEPICTSVVTLPGSAIHNMLSVYCPCSGLGGSLCSPGWESTAIYPKLKTSGEYESPIHSTEPLNSLRQSDTYVTHICVCNVTIIGLGNGLLPYQQPSNYLN